MEIVIVDNPVEKLSSLYVEGRILSRTFVNNYNL